MASGITRRLAQAGPAWVAIYALTAAFVTYFSMYAFRKPFVVGNYEGVSGWIFAADFKITIVIAQVMGYALSKLMGIKVVSEAKPQRRAFMIIGFILLSWLGLILFAVVPAPLKVVAIFMSSLPLGMIWGLVFGFLEGRRASEWLGTGLCISFIVSSGVVKSVGRALVVDYNIPDLWMPAATGAIFFPVLALSVWMLSQTPPPDERDMAERMVRQPMFRDERRAFVARAGLGLVLLVLAYVILTALRDFRDNFAFELWDAIGYGDEPSVFSLSELPIAAFILLVFGLSSLIRDNRRAVLFYHLMIIAGAAIIGAATWAWQADLLSPLWWMIAVGAGVYLGFIPFNAVLADRLTAALGMPGNAAFFMYVADASGYGGSVALMLLKNLGLSLSWLDFFTMLCYASAAIVGMVTFVSASHFYLRIFVDRTVPQLVDHKLSRRS
jgi:MFS family permease